MSEEYSKNRTMGKYCEMVNHVAALRFNTTPSFSVIWRRQTHAKLVSVAATPRGQSLIWTWPRPPCCCHPSIVISY